MIDPRETHRRRFRRLAAVALGAAAAVAVAVALSTGGAAPRPVRTVAAQPPAAVTVTPSTGGAAPQPGRSVQPDQSVRPDQSGGPEVTQPPAPHVLNFAQDVQEPAKQLPSAATTAPVAADADGCDHAYGEINQCVPRSFPVEVPSIAAARCGWLLAHGFQSLAVHGRDDLGLDTNHDGVACGKGDAGVPL